MPRVIAHGSPHGALLWTAAVDTTMAAAAAVAAPLLLYVHCEDRKFIVTADLSEPVSSLYKGMRAARALRATGLAPNL